MTPWTGPNSEIIFLVRTDFSDNDAWRRVDEVAGREGTNVETVNDPAHGTTALCRTRGQYGATRSPANRHLYAATLASEVPTYAQGVLLADHVTSSTSDQFVMVCPTDNEVAPFRAPAALLAYVVCPIVLGTCHWSELSGLVNQDGVLRLLISERTIAGLTSA